MNAKFTKTGSECILAISDIAIYPYWVQFRLWTQKLENETKLVHIMYRESCLMCLLQS